MLRLAFVLSNRKIAQGSEWHIVTVLLDLMAGLLLLPLIGVFVAIFFTLVTLVTIGTFYLFLFIRLWLMKQQYHL